MAQLIWLITGTTSGIGRTLVQAVAARGDKVIATGRNAEERLTDLKSSNLNIALLDLDVTAGRTAVEQQIQKAIAIFGHIDVVINNAGWNSVRALEDVDDDYLAQMFSVNVFGAVHVTQAVLPHFRSRKSGTVAFMGSASDWVTIPYTNAYSMAKAALAQFAEGLSKEVSQHGIRSVLFEAGMFPTLLGQPREGDGQMVLSEPYQVSFMNFMGTFMTDVAPKPTGSVEKLGKTIVDCIRGEGLVRGRKLPVRVALGIDAMQLVEQKCQQQLQLLSEWEEVSMSTNLEGVTEVPPAVLGFASII